MEIKTFPVGDLRANCHMVINQDLNHVVLIDCGGSENRLMDYITQNNLEVKAILLTHGHYDHFEGVSYIQDKTNCNVYISTQDCNMLTSSKLSLANDLGYDDFHPVKNFKTVSDGDIITEADFNFKVLSTSGHTIGSVCYLCDDCLFTGDTLFNGSMGRTDFPTGNFFDMMKSLKRLYNLEGNYKVYAGHNANTDLQSERDKNPYMRDATNDDLFAY